LAKLRLGQDPGSFITYIRDLRQQMSDLDHKYNDHQFMMHVLSGLGDDYEYLVYNLDHHFMADPPMLTIDLIHDELSGKYEKLKSKYIPTPAFTVTQYLRINMTPLMMK
jgi:hypothetical protein